MARIGIRTAIYSAFRNLATVPFGSTRFSYIKITAIRADTLSNVGIPSS